MNQVYCHRCGCKITSGTYVRDGCNNSFHNDCLNCHACKTKLTIYYTNENKNYCKNCYNNKFGTCCVKCKKFIKSNRVSYENAGASWHKECFTCDKCSTQLAYDSFFEGDDGKLVCRICFLKHKGAKKCIACTKSITDQKYIGFRDHDWHKDCFKCSLCLASPVGCGCVPDSGNILCVGCAVGRLKVIVPDFSYVLLSLSSPNELSCEASTGTPAECKAGPDDAASEHLNSIDKHLDENLEKPKVGKPKKSKLARAARNVFWFLYDLLF